jgi:hypothetical protein
MYPVTFLILSWYIPSMIKSVVTIVTIFVNIAVGWVIESEAVTMIHSIIAIGEVVKLKVYCQRGDLLRF